MVGGILGSYRVLSELGRGGMGAVYLAEHTLIGKRAAAKILLPQFSRDAAIVERFFNEARAATQIRHPGIVEIFDFGYHESGCAYLVMEYLDGESLSSKIMREGGRLPEATMSEITRQLASALRAAHDKKIIHRDLKPDNAFVVADPDMPMGMRIKLLDFGIAKLSGDNAGSTKTRTGTMMGTPAYMSPEQCRGAGLVDARSDVYSLGCMMFEMVTGRTPFVGEGPGDVIGAHIFSEVPSARQLTPSLSPGVDLLISATLQKLPDARPQSMVELLKRLEAVGAIRRSGIQEIASKATVKINRDARTISSPPSTTLGGAAAELRPPIADKSAARFILPVLGVIGLAAGAGWYFTRPPAGEPQKPTPGTQAPLVIHTEPLVKEVEPPVKRETPPTPPRTRIKLSLDSQPAGADVYRTADGLHLGKTPLTEELTQGSGEAGYLLKMHGYRDQRVSLPITQDVTTVLTMEKTGSGSKPPPTGKPPTVKPPTVKPAEPAKPARNDVVDPFAN